MSTYKQMLQGIDRRNRLRWAAIWPRAPEIESAGRLFLSDVLEETILCHQQYKNKNKERKTKVEACHNADIRLI